MPLDRLDVADLHERQRLAVEQSGDALERVVRSDVDIVEEDPVDVGDR